MKGAATSAGQDGGELSALRMHPHGSDPEVRRPSPPL